MEYRVVHVLVRYLSSILDQNPADAEDLIEMSFRPLIAQMFIEDVGWELGEWGFISRVLEGARFRGALRAEGRRVRLREEGIIVG